MEGCRNLLERAEICWERSEIRWKEQKSAGRKQKTAKRSRFEQKSARSPSREQNGSPVSENTVLLAGFAGTCYSLRMLHEQVREARIARGLSQVKLAQLAGVPRSQLRNFENGEGITLTTFLKIIAQLPNLERLALGPTELQLQNVDVEELRAMLTELIAAAAGVLAVLQTAVPRSAPDTASAAAAGAGRHHPPVTERPRAEELNAIARALARGASAPRDHS